MILKGLIFIILLGLAFGGGYYPGKVVQGLEALGIHQLSGMGNTPERNNRIRLVLLGLLVFAGFLIFGALNVRIGAIGLVLGILIVYYSYGISQLVGNTFPTIPGMTVSTTVNLAGLGLVIFSIGWMTGLFQQILAGLIQ